MMPNRSDHSGRGASAAAADCTAPESPESDLEGGAKNSPQGLEVPSLARAESTEILPSVSAALLRAPGGAAWTVAFSALPSLEPPPAGTFPQSQKPCLAA
ncbi:hypothetical protein FALBO_4530 [Fusarium albosuccineum]|uniref:Uncharacterized protein n=1 Tax=Fusarium albosuccineum TaxID=1237068 RepID=A0A8H4LGF7_9HYPO|nr:hypothetical protein FALBO_4530 [Fusarium albosuccineum]